MENTAPEMVKPAIITMKDTGEKYELDFNREAVQFAEKHDFVIDDVPKFPATMIPELFWYSFRKNHRRMTQMQTDKILEKMGGMNAKLATRLIELYKQAGYTGIIAVEDDEKNSEVDVEL